ncbi:MAG: four-helix bundle copper-binding protein [Opitutus sp.]|nr:four-helix bundle copper-binding protein [Opitutus sp.]
MATTTLDPVSPAFASTKLEELQNALAECRVACGHSADTWLANSPLAPDALRCIRLMLDCADLCMAAEELLPFVPEISPSLLRSRLNTCAVACERCVRDAQRHRTGPVAASIDACRRAGRACQEILPLLPTVAIAAA